MEVAMLKKDKARALDDLLKID